MPTALGRLTGWLTSWLPRPAAPAAPVAPAARPPRMRATYDAAQSTPALERHWANADALSAKAANSPDVRRRLRERARLEFDNGGNCKGAIETIAHDLVGTGPRLQLTLPDDAPDGAAAVVERKFRDWCDDPVVNFADKLRMMAESELRDGESFALLVANQAVEGPVKFDFQVVETEQVATPNLNVLDPSAVDGIEFDAAGNATAYHLLKQHPGDLGAFVTFGEYTRVPAAQVIHWFRPSRAGHVRGIPRITPGLPLMAMIRGYASATLAAAGPAADSSAVPKNKPPPPEDEDPVEAYDKFPVHDGEGMTLPYGWDIYQYQPTQPTATHKEFRETNLAEFGRSIHCPKNVVTGDSGNMNFASSRLDHLMYRGAIRIERDRLGVRVSDRLFKAWLAEAMVAPGYLPAEILAALPDPSLWTWAWRFDGFPSINPTDDATADEKNLHNGLVTHGELLAQRGVPWRDHFKSLAEQFAEAKRLGIVELLYPWLANAAPAPGSPALSAGADRQPTTQAERDTILEEEAARA
jgi:lambda family phage portal protein